MSDHDGEGPSYRTAINLEEWSHQWELKPDWLSCRACGTVQTFHGASVGRAFPDHMPNCHALGRGDQFPLHNLRSLLKGLLPPVQV